MERRSAIVQPENEEIEGGSGEKGRIALAVVGIKRRRGGKPNLKIVFHNKELTKALRRHGVLE